MREYIEPATWKVPGREQMHVKVHDHRGAIGAFHHFSCPCSRGNGSDSERPRNWPLERTEGLSTHRAVMQPREPLVEFLNQRSKHERTLKLICTFKDLNGL